MWLGEEKQCYEEYGTLCPPKSCFEKHDPELYHAVRAVSKKKDRHSFDIGGYLDSHWKPNVTMVDLDWEESEDRKRNPVDVAFNPFNFAYKLLISEAFRMLDGGKVSRLCDWAGVFFRLVSMMVVMLRHNMLVEFI